MSERDFYSGFEGEPDVVIWSVSGGTLLDRLRMWEGDFDAIVGRVDPTSSGWTGLWAEYHAGDGFDEPWRDPAPHETAEQLRGLSLDGSGRVGEVHRAWLDLLREAARCGADVYVLRD